MLYDDYRERSNGRPAIKAVAETWTRPKQPNGTTAALTRCTVPAYRKFESISLHQRVINEPGRANWAINSPVAEERYLLANARASWLTAS